ncbi:hypothetical protein [Dongia sp.]|uniref:hypothetical protein n=1 Tax=Dongia sp. TaxID=1977262 RepID=UPI0035B044C8
MENDAKAPFNANNISLRYDTKNPSPQSRGPCGQPRSRCGYPASGDPVSLDIGGRFRDAEAIAEFLAGCLFDEFGQGIAIITPCGWAGSASPERLRPVSASAATEARRSDAGESEWQHRQQSVALDTTRDERDSRDADR